MAVSSSNSTLTAAEIRVIQKRLAVHGFDPGAADGVLGPRTSAAIVAFKRAQGFAARPWVGPLTWAALVADPRHPGSVTELPWLVEARRVMGWHEREDNRQLRDWLKSDGNALGDPAVYPWCGDFVETAIRLALPGEAIPANPYWALNWRRFGRPCGPLRGAVVSVVRPGGGHVAFAVGQDATRIYCLGGNQSNRVSVAPIEKTRFVPESWRWPLTWPFPDNGVLPWMSSAEASSTNEA